MSIIGNISTVRVYYYIKWSTLDQQEARNGIQISASSAGAATKPKKV